MKQTSTLQTGMGEADIRLIIDRLIGPASRPQSPPPDVRSVIVIIAITMINAGHVRLPGAH